ncbi:unnamed protein product [Brachionus calyciflorus]|uniref:Uncharacterized protein n=1 Tax=Brachionus calyciflorus TaxID=104777 RepID=A0A813QQ49_9BILA|nr:unnamed protein product [Brachionus calyciflorus]
MNRFINESDSNSYDDLIEKIKSSKFLIESYKAEIESKSEKDKIADKLSSFSFSDEMLKIIEDYENKNGYLFVGFYESKGSANGLGYVTLNTIQKIKSEKVNKDKISNCFEIDSKSIKQAYDELYPAVQENRIKGYVQSIYSDPFGLLLMSSFQIKILSVVQKNFPIWFFDATGCILKDIPGESKTILFSIVCHDVSRKIIIPLADFFTNILGSRTISNFLSQIKELIERNIEAKVENQYPKIVVLDFTWANINAFLETFNKVSIYQYLVWSKELIINANYNVYNIIPVKIMLCCTHFLKIIVDKVMKNFKNIDNNVIKDFIFCFTLLQNSKTFKEFEDILIDLFYIYNSKFLNVKLVERIKIIEEKILNRQNDCNYFFEEFSINSLKKDSPFTKYRLLGVNLHKENHFIFLIFTDEIFYKADNLSRGDLPQMDTVENWRITNIFYERS